jgi:flagellar biosynthetic protein FliQ
MTPELAADLFRNTLWITFELCAPILGAMTLAAVIFGVIQAATQVQDSTVSFTPKLAAAIAVAWMTAAWMGSTLSAFMHKAIAAIPWMVAR